MFFKVMTALALLGPSANLVAGERTTILNSQSKFHVSHEEALKHLNNLKSLAAKEPSKQRPPISKIAVFNGGTAQVEEPFSDRAKPCWADEYQFQEIQLTLLNPWLKSWKEKNLSAFNSLLIKNAKIDPFAVGFKSTPSKLGNINFYNNWHEITAAKSINDYVQQFNKVEDFDLITLKYTSPRADRDKKLDMVRAELHIQFDLRGTTSNKELRNDRGPMKVSVVKVNGKWKIEEIKNWGLETLTNATPAFVDMTNVSGVTTIPEYQRVEAIRRGGYAIAMGDVNNDGIQDLYLGAYGPGKLLMGKKDGTFAEAIASGIAEDTLVKSATFADFNNDGLADLLLVRFVSSNERTETKANFSREDIIIYQNTGKGKYKKAENIIIERSASDTAMPAAVADFNEDGLLDFYIGFPGTKDFTTFGKTPEREGIRAQGIYYNQGAFKFKETDVTDYHLANNKYDKVTEHQRIYPHSSVALDFDQNGSMDIMVIDDRGNISPAYQNTGKGKFIQAEQYIGITTAGSGMGMAFADIDNNGVLDMVYSNVNFNNKYRTDVSCKANWNNDVFGTKDHGLKFYYGMRKGQFADATMKNGLFYAGEGLAGVEFIDYNNDGFQDLYVANGLWSGTDKEQDLSHVFTRSHLVTEERTFMENRNDSQSLIMKILTGFTGDLFTGKNGTARPGLAGHQRNRLFRNNGDGTFIEVGFLEGADSIADGYVIAKADINADGAEDIILRNGDPGSKEVNFPAVQVFQNQLGKNSVRLKLVATSANTNTDAIGSSVVLSTSKNTQYRQLISNNGTAQSARILHFGLGDETSAKKIVITWPNGKQTELKDVAAGMHTVYENNRELSSVK